MFPTTSLPKESLYRAKLVILPLEKTHVYAAFTVEPAADWLAGKYYYGLKPVV
jgi:hypothetical protein